MRSSEVPRDRWAQTSVQSAMRSLRELRTVSPETPALKALEEMSREDINQLPVVSNGKIEGIFSRGQVLRYLQTHAELHGGHVPTGINSFREQGRPETRFPVPDEHRGFYWPKELISKRCASPAEARNGAMRNVAPVVAPVLML